MSICLRSSFDVCNGPQFDLGTPLGFIHALTQTLRLAPGSLLWGGVPCSSQLCLTQHETSKTWSTICKSKCLYISTLPSSSRWVWLSRSSSKRSKEDVLGDLSRPFVALGNMLSARFALLALVAVVCQCYWIVSWLIYKTSLNS